MPTQIPRGSYAHMFGPTTGDKVRLADTGPVADLCRSFNRVLCAKGE